jgi:hypothetical protein
MNMPWKIISWKTNIFGRELYIFPLCIRASSVIISSDCLPLRKSTHLITQFLNVFGSVKYHMQVLALPNGDYGAVFPGQFFVPNMGLMGYIIWCTGEHIAWWPRGLCSQS